MSSETEIANAALTLLGEKRISSLDDSSKPARELKAIFTITRDALLAGYNWSFAMARTKLSPLADVPAFDYGLQFLMPTECLRVIQISQIYVGADLTDYRNYDTSEYVIEGRNILTDLDNPLPIRYVKRITDTTLFIPNFVSAFAAKLAYDGAEPITQSGSKKDRAMQQYKTELSIAIRANAIELPPRKLPDDEWLLSRL